MAATETTIAATETTIAASIAGAYGDGNGTKHQGQVAVEMMIAAGCCCCSVGWVVTGLVVVVGLVVGVRCPCLRKKLGSSHRRVIMTQ